MKIDTRLEEIGDRLERSVAADLRTEQRAAGAAATRARRTRPRLLAGSTLGLAGVGAALVLALGGTAATSPAYAITQKGDGSVFIKFNYDDPRQRGARPGNRQGPDELHAGQGG
jgi:hypothetical protein